MILALLQWLLLLLLLSLLVRIVRRRRHHPPLLIHLLLLLHHRLPRGRWVHNIHMTTAAATTTGSRPTLPLRLLTVRIVRIFRCRSLLLLHRRTAHHGAIGIIRSRNRTSTCDNIVGRSTTAIATRIRTTANVVGRGICIHSMVASSRSTITTGIACIRIRIRIRNRIRIARIRIQQAPATSTTPCIGTTGSTGMAGIIIGGHWPPTTAAGEVWVDRPSSSGTTASSPNH